MVVDYTVWTNFRSQQSKRGQGEGSRVLERHYQNTHHGKGEMGRIGKLDLQQAIQKEYRQRTEGKITMLMFEKAVINHSILYLPTIAYIYI